MKIYVSVILLILPFIAYGQSEELTPGKPVERDLKGGEVHRYQIQLNTGHFVGVIAEQKGIDVVARLRALDGEVVREIDSPNGANGPETIWYISSNQGPYTVEIESLEKEAKPGKYELKIAALNESTADDRSFIAAESLMLETSNLGDLNDPTVREKAVPRLDEAAKYYELINDKRRRSDGLTRLGDLFGKVGQNERALRYLDRAIALYLEDGHRREAMQAMIAAQTWAQTQVEYIARNDKIRLMAISLKDRRTEAFALREMAYGYYNVGDFPRAIEHTKESISIAVAINEMGLAEGNYDNLGILNSAQGNYALALESHQKAIEIQMATGRKNPRKETILNIGNVYHGLGSYRLAIENFERAKVGNSKIAAFAISNIGTSYLEMGVYDKALEFFLEAQPLKAKFLPDDPTTFHNLASVYKATNRPQEAVTNIQKAIELNQKIADNDGLTRAYILMAEMQLDAKAPAKSLEYANLAIALSREFDYTKNLWTALTAAAGAQLSLGQTADARRSLGEAISLVEHLRTQLVAGEQSSGGFFEQKGRPYQMMIGLMVAAGEMENAFALSERTKGRSLLDSLGGGRINISKAMTPKELETETSLKYELASLNFKKAEETDKAKLLQLNGKLDRKRLELEDFRTRLYASHPELKVRRGEITPVTLKEAGSVLGDKETAALEFLVADDKTYVFVVTTDASKKPLLKSYVVDVTRDELARKVERYRDEIATGKLEFKNQAREIFDLLIKPATSRLTGINSLIIIPDGPLWELPFQALQDDKNKALIEKTAVSYAPSLTALGAMSKEVDKLTAPNLELFAMGNPVVGKVTSSKVRQVFMSETMESLPEAERLVNVLGTMYGPTRSKIYTGDAAREVVAKTEAPSYRIVQFATHGILNDTSPMYSHIVLSQKDDDPKEDGLLEAWEMKDLDLKADMVILSACDTARGKINSGEGVIGMTWALFIAGAPTTVASQWKVESSSTTELMLEFHRQLLAKKRVSKAEALRRASLKLLKTERYKHPVYWAGFVLVGDGS